MKRRIIYIFLFAVISLQSRGQVRELVKSSPYVSTPPTEEVARDKITLNGSFSHHEDDGEVAFRLDKSLVLDVGESNYVGQIDIDNYQINRSGPYRGLTGNLGVSPMGGATYTVPIEVPVGFAGLQPNLALVYNSMAGIGPCGIGWNLSGISSISRTTPTMYHDGGLKEIQFNTDDEFVWDGQRLIKHIEGTDGSGNFHITFYPESYNGSTVEAYTSSSANPGSIDWFEITMENGTIFTYDWAFTSEGGKTYSWYLSEIEDLKGNKMTIEYGGKPSGGIGDPVGLIHPAVIEYNKNGTEEAISQVRFIYENGIEGLKYMAGEAIETGRLLRSIEVIEKDRIFRKYEIKYENVDDLYERIVGVSVKNGDGEQLNPIYFGYGDIGQITRTEKSLSTLTLYGAEIYGNGQRISLDFNGDGLRDLLVVDIDETTISMSQIGEMDVKGAIADLYVFKGEIINDSYELTYQTHRTDFGMSYVSEFISTKSVFVPIDLDGDGDDELLFQSIQKIGNDPAYIDLRVVEPTDLTNATIIAQIEVEKYPEVSFGNINGDGLLDIILIKKEASISGTLDAYIHETIYLQNNGGFSFTQAGNDWLDTFDDNSAANKFIVADINNDGLSDIMLVSKMGYNIHLNQAFADLSPPCLFKSGIGISDNTISVDYSKSTSRNLAGGDFNGDGLLDFLVNRDATNWFLCISDGSGHFESSQVTISASNYLNDLDGANKDDGIDNCYVADYNGDGRSDVIVVDGKLTWESGEFVNDGSKIYVFISDEYGSLELIQSFDHQSTNKILKPYTDYFNIGDYNFDGLNDLLWYTGDESDNATSFKDKYFLFSVNGTKSANKIEKIANGLGVKSSIGYDFLIDGGDIYNKTSSADGDSKLQQLAGSILVVEEVSTDYGDSSPVVITYTYDGALIHNEGKGFLGFDEVRSENTTTKIISVQTTNSRTIGTYFPISITSTVSKDTELLSTQVNTMGDTLVSGRSYLNYMDVLTQTDELSEIVTTTDFTYSDLKLTTKEIDYGEDYIDRTQYEYNVLGQPSKVTFSKVDASDQSIDYQNETTLSYDTNTGNLLQKVENSNLTTDYQVKTEYLDYNGVGSVGEVKVSSGTLPTHSTTYSYISADRVLQSQTTDVGTESYSYNHFGQVTSVTNPYGEISQTTYDKWGQVALQITPVGEELTSTINFETSITGTGFMNENKSSFNPSGFSRVYYNAKGQEVYTEVTGYENVVVSSEKDYNTDGSILKKSLPKYPNETEKFTNYSHLPDGRLDVTTYPTGRTVDLDYNANNEIVTKVNGLSYKKTFSNNGSLESSTDPLNNTIQYTYHPHGRLHKLIDPSGNFVESTYDDLLNQTGLSDPDAGNLSYTFDAYGMLKTQENGNSLESSLQYDNLGRLTSKTVESDFDVTIAYYNEGNGKDQQKSITGSNGISYSYGYNENRRLAKETQVVDANHSYINEFVYNSKGQIDDETINDQIQLDYTYSIDGTLEKIQLIDVENSINETVWELTTLNEITREYTLGNGTAETWTNNSYGFPMEVKVNGVFEFDFDWDAQKGLLKSRTQKVYNNSGVVINTLTEEFNYDNLNRLTYRKSTSDGDGADITYKSNGFGQIDTKSDVGRYQYNATGSPHQLKSVSNSFPDFAFQPEYDITYTSFDKVAEITQGTEKRMAFTYGPDNSRKKVEYYENSSLIYTRYYSGIYEKTVYSSGDLNENYYIGGTNGLTAIYNILNGTGNLYYVHKDYLGSIISLTDENGDLVSGNQFSFDAWGRRRDTNWEFTDETGTPITTRGFTGHEHIDEFNLINMNGRVYDPLTAQFLSPDNYIQSPDNIQNLNRYAYALNNPLIYTDPDGEFIHLIIGAIIGGTINLATHWKSVDNFWEGLGYFGIGAAAGALSAGIGAGVNVAMASGSFSAGFLGTAAGVSSTGFLAGASTGAAAGFTNGLITGTGNAALNGSSFTESIGSGFNAAWKQGAFGGLTGGLFGGIQAASKDVNFFTGKANFDITDGVGAHGVGKDLRILKAKYVGEFEGVNMYESSKLGTGYGSGGVTLPGKGIIVGKTAFSQAQDMGLVKHEFGHILQSRITGKLSFYRVIGKESILSAAKHGKNGYSHNTFWAETWANHLSYNYFGQPSSWNLTRFPVGELSLFNRLRLVLGAIP